MQQNKPATVNRHIATIKHMFTKAVEWNMVEEDVLKRIRKVKVVGDGQDANDIYKGFLYSEGVYTELLPPEWISADALGINNSGALVGHGYDGTNTYTGFLYSEGVYTELLPPWLKSARPNDINDSGEVVGYGQDANYIYKGFLYSAGVYTELLPPGFAESYPYAINNSGAVVGGGDEKGFIATPINKPIKVNIDIKPGSCPNPIGFADNKGVVSFAIMGTTDFDITQIDPASIRITREGVDAEVAPIRLSYEDVATPYTDDEACQCHELIGDGYIDLSMKGYKHDLVYNLRLQEVAGETIPLIVTGKLKDEFGGTAIEGKDCVWVLKSVLKE